MSDFKQTMEELPDKRSTKDYGPYSAYCKVCWNPVYALWIDDVPHNGVCMFGHSRAEDCPDAMGRARDSAAIRKRLANVTAKFIEHDQSLENDRMEKSKLNKPVRFILFFVLPILISVVLLMGTVDAQTRQHSEASYVHEWCNRYAGRVEVIQEDRTRVDCETYFHAIEFDFADKWAEAIGQALHYSIMTGKRAGIVLIVEDPGAMRYVERVRNIVASYSLPIDIWLTD